MRILVQIVETNTALKFWEFLKTKLLKKMRDDDKVDPMEAQLEAQQELASLHRQYRCMRNAKKAYTTETENVIRRQKAVIEALVEEKTELMTLKNVAGRVVNQVEDEKSLEDINNLMEKEECIKEEMEAERKNQDEIDADIYSLETMIAKQRQTMKGVTNVTKNVAVHKHVRVLKNRLDNLSKKFNVAMAGNQKLRMKIDHVNGQKARFKKIFRRLENSLAEIKAEIEKTSETATSHFNARNEAQHRMASLRERGERDLTMYNNEIKDVMRAIEHDRKLRKFMITKAEDRASILEEETMARELRKLNMHLGGLKHEAKKYEEIFEKIKEATGIHDTDTLVSSFIENEDTNFALFNYVNAMNTEIEELQDQIKFLKEETELTKNDGVANDIRRKEILHELEALLATVTAQSSTLTKEVKTNRKIIENAKPKIEKIFVGMKCDRSVITNLLGGGTAIDDYNVMQYMGIIEQKCNELLQMKALLKAKSTLEDLQKEGNAIEGLQGAGPQPLQGKLSINPPSIEEESDLMLQTSDTKPLTMDDVQALLVQLTARGGTSKGAGAGVTSKQGRKKRF